MAQQITARTRELPRVEEKQVKIITMRQLVFRRLARARLATVPPRIGFCHDSHALGHWSSRRPESVGRATLCPLQRQP